MRTREWLRSSPSPSRSPSATAAPSSRPASAPCSSSGTPSRSLQARRKAAEKVRRQQPADIQIFLGAPGTGKSHGLLEAVRAGLPRVLLWDPRHEYELPRAKYSSTAQELAKQILDGHPGPWIIRPTFNLKRKRLEFDKVCQAAIAAQLDALQPRMTFAVEECAEIITSPGNPPEHLLQIAIQSRHYGMRVLIAGQRPTFVDTSMRGSVTLIRCGRLALPADCRMMAEWMGVEDHREIQRMPDRHGFVFQNGNLTRF